MPRARASCRVLGAWLKGGLPPVKRLAASRCGCVVLPHARGTRVLSRAAALCGKTSMRAKCHCQQPGCSCLDAQQRQTFLFNHQLYDLLSLHCQPPFHSQNLQPIAFLTPCVLGCTIQHAAAAGSNRRDPQPGCRAHWGPWPPWPARSGESGLAKQSGPARSERELVGPRAGWTRTALRWWTWTPTTPTF